MLGGAVFSQFFLLTLYMQQVLGYSAIETGVAYIPLSLSISLLGRRTGAGHADRRERVLPVGLALSTVALVIFSRLPVDGSYSGTSSRPSSSAAIGLALAFVPMSIGALTASGAGRRDRVRAHHHEPADRRRDRRGDRHHGGRRARRRAS